MAWLARLLGTREDESAALQPLWRRIVAIAREPEWYLPGPAGGGVADSKEGRFDMLALVAALVMLRMERGTELVAASARLTECFVADIEGQLRQEGIGDPTIGKRMGQLIGALGGRIGALREGLDGRDAALIEVVARNVTFGEAGDSAFVAKRARELAERLAGLSDTALLAGEIAR